VVSRLVDQKGFDLLAAALGPLLEELPVQVAVLGTGQPEYEGLLAHLEERYPGRVRAWLTFDAALAQRIYAGADMFLMPSRFEPCGLGQMIAMRYGTVPIVRATGGLADTVQEGPAEAPGTGFVFWEYQAEALLAAIRRAVAAFRQPEVWHTIMRQGMEADRAWDGPAREYAALYQEAVQLRLGAIGAESR
jgi:starch synthase